MARLIPTIALVATLAFLLASALDNGAGLVPPLGWSTWCDDGDCGMDYCSEIEVKQSAEAMLANGMHGAGYHWVFLDDCWAAGSRTSNGSITWDTSRFPSGIPALTEWLHSRGLKFGLYTSMGNTTCSSGGRPYPIPGSEGHYQEDMNSFAAWNVDAVKADWCGDVKKMPLDGILVGAKDYIAVSRAITNTTPPRVMYIEGVAAVLFLLTEVPTYMNAWRASTDHHDSWRNTVEVLATVQLASVPGRVGGWSDMDVLMTGGQGCKNRHHTNNDTLHCPGMTDEEYLTEFTFWNLMQSPLVVATDIRNMTAIMKRVLLNKRFIDIHQNTSTPPGSYLGHDDDCGYGILSGIVCQIWTRTLGDGRVMVALYNAALDPASANATITLDFSKFKGKLPAGYDSNATVMVEDLWDGANTGTDVTGKYTSKSLPPHSVACVVLHPTW